MARYYIFPEFRTKGHTLSAANPGQGPVKAEPKSIWP